MQIKFCGPLVVASDMRTSRMFYETVFEQRLRFDLGDCQRFESGVTLQSADSMGELYGLGRDEVLQPGVNMVLHFEVDDFLGFVRRVKETPGLRLLHDVVEFPWGQRSLSFYDPDGHVLDVSESMEAVCRRFLQEGKSVEQVADRTEHTVEFVRSVAAGMRPQEEEA